MNNLKKNGLRLSRSFQQLPFFVYTFNRTGPKYLPIIFCGDFNLEPYTGVYKFITQGSFTYQGKGRNLEPQDYRYLSNMLLPPHLHITDSCQHFNVLLERTRGEGTGQVMVIIVSVILFSYFIRKRNYFYFNYQ